MLPITYLLLGVLVGSLLSRLALRKKKAALEDRIKQDASRYEKLWLEATELLHTQGQISDEQLARITPPKEKLPRKDGFSDDRRDVEIARAKAGLPPADNLEGMFSDDVRDVEQARIRYGTSK